MIGRKVVSLIMAAAGVLELTACDDASNTPTESERATAEHIAKIWDVSFNRRGSATGNRVTGQLAFVSNGAYRRASGGDPGNFGTYSIDFASIGFNLDNESIPVAVAWPLPGDSAEIVLGSPEGTCVVIRASARDDEMRGTWYLRLPRGAGASGTFSATPRFPLGH
ncbi:MAG TPA: hypothetical protein VKO87_11295 [Gemmatimonadaceae bacterium]|nr:hypothetical protein [Gemmatimonadaceae bacterium]